MDEVKEKGNKEGLGKAIALVVAIVLLFTGLINRIGDPSGSWEVHTVLVGKRQKIQRRAIAKKKRCIYDEGVTENILCGGNIKVFKRFKGPLVSFDMCGHMKRTAKYDPEGKGFPILMRKECAEVVWAINKAMKRETGKCIRLTSEKATGGRPHLRSNEEQTNARRRYDTGVSGIAAKPYYSNHENGCALDVINWKEVMPFALRLGWSIGPRNCIPNDPVHLSSKKPCSFGKATMNQWKGNVKKRWKKLWKRSKRKKKR